MMANFQVYKDARGQWRWRFQAGNNKIVADSAEGYQNRTDCLEGIRIVKKEAPSAPAWEKDATGEWKQIPGA
jgi:uncharacterized protein